MVEARFWKVQEKEGRDYGVEKEGGVGGGGLATSKTEIGWELEQHWRWLDQGVGMRESEWDGWEGG